jgi:hypothetical protein
MEMEPGKAAPRLSGSKWKQAGSRLSPGLRRGSSRPTGYSAIHAINLHSNRKEALQGSRLHNLLER